MSVRETVHFAAVWLSDPGLVLEGSTFSTTLFALNLPLPTDLLSAVRNSTRFPSRDESHLA